MWLNAGSQLRGPKGKGSKCGCCFCCCCCAPQGQGMVAGQAVLTAGALNPTEYRCYDVADAPAADDCAALALALQQRFATQVAPPDLLLVDGGKGQLSAARGRLRHLGLAIPVVALSKREELLYFAGRRAPLRLPRGSPALRLLQRARDEAHATANLGHRAMRYTPLRSCLDGVPGLGQARAAALLMQFRTADALKAASPEALQAVPGIGPVLGAKVHAHLQSQGDTRALQIGRKQLQDLNLEGIVSAELAMSTGKFALGLEGSDADEAAMAERAADAWYVEGCQSHTDACACWVLSGLFRIMQNANHAPSCPQTHAHTGCYTQIHTDVQCYTQPELHRSRTPPPPSRSPVF